MATAVTAAPTKNEEPRCLTRFGPKLAPEQPGQTNNMTKRQAPPNNGGKIVYDIAFHMCGDRGQMQHAVSQQLELTNQHFAQAGSKISFKPIEFRSLPQGCEQWRIDDEPLRQHLLEQIKMERRGRNGQQHPGGRPGGIPGGHPGGGFPGGPSGGFPGGHPPGGFPGGHPPGGFPGGHPGGGFPGGHPPGGFPGGHPGGGFPGGPSGGFPGGHPGGGFPGGHPPDGFPGGPPGGFPGVQRIDSAVIDIMIMASPRSNQRGLNRVLGMCDVGHPSYAARGCSILSSTLGSIGDQRQASVEGHGFALTHEIGHFLGLMHTFGDGSSPQGACGEFDGFSDTAPQSAPTGQFCPNERNAVSGSRSPFPGSRSPFPGSRSPFPGMAGDQGQCQCTPGANANNIMDYSLRIWNGLPCITFKRSTTFLNSRPNNMPAVEAATDRLEDGQAVLDSREALIREALIREALIREATSSGGGGPSRR
ncbi:hypothetical protein CDD80_3304 [Ophiocordyceps camponoti-rufipedis]|uniref:Peptidase M43 pregnancy-associated plasma-A domain-containing protein n=1 Tax=Ophiocordyceps camponoti-rufipedis TaxID=2004952 RepID=A0A2C5Z426_9HYPO|nr:hypothetical protein CDD80_3304 [Ophiocordyceps camponoti-rufipedis]